MSTPLPEMLETLARAAHGAGRIVLDVREGGVNVRRKPDDSPVTQADTMAEEYIERALARAFPDLPLIGEELTAAGRAVAPAERFFLVDPLDGTREFIAGRDSFSTNIALVEHGRPVAGVIYAPLRAEMVVGAPGAGLWRARVDAHAPFDASALRPFTPFDEPRPMRRAVVSFSHLDEKTLRWLKARGVTDQVRMGSAYKFCLLLTGEADVYPRFGPTMEWDTAAGHALLQAAGGAVLLPDGSAPLTYGHVNRGFLNPGFVAFAPGVEVRT